MKYEITVLIETEADSKEDAVLNVLDYLGENEDTENNMLLNVKEGEKV